VSYLSASAVVIHYEEALYQVYAPLPLPLVIMLDLHMYRKRYGNRTVGRTLFFSFFSRYRPNEISITTYASKTSQTNCEFWNFNLGILCPLTAVFYFFFNFQSRTLKQGHARDFFYWERRPKAECWCRGWGSWEGDSNPSPPARKSGECRELSKRCSGRSPDRPKVSAISRTQDGLSWHYNIVDLSCSRCGNKTPVSLCILPCSQALEFCYRPVQKRSYP